jgi:hypothetical protein
MRRVTLALVLLHGLLHARTTEALPPSEVVQRGSQPPEIVSGLSLAQPDLLELLPSSGSSGGACMHCPGSSEATCVQCHFGLGSNDTWIHRNWRGSMMAHASRDPLTWAALAVAEQDFPGAGDTCIRCHVTKGWIEGRSVPSDGSALLDEDADGVTCHLCHRLANPGDSEAGVVGVQPPSFAAFGPACVTGDAHAGVACDPETGMPCAGGKPACANEVFHGNAMIALFQDATTSAAISRLGPYANAQTGNFHGFKQSTFQRDAALCGTCHDVSNPVTGDLAPTHGRLAKALPAGAFSGVPNGPVLEKAGFRNPPYAYGVEQRTYSEWVASAFSATPVSAAGTLPAELLAPGGAIQRVADATAPDGGNYDDGTPRSFSCQSCHMRPASAQGCYIASERSDLPVHDLTGANTFAPRAILYLDDATLHGVSRLRLGGGLDADARDATTSAIARAEASLRSAASLQLTADPAVLANTVRVVNLSGHKLFTGYPEGRRIWLNVKWYGPSGALLREDGAYGPLAVAEDLDGDGASPDVVQTLLDPESPHTRVWGVESGISKEWATRLVGTLELAATTPLAFDRVSGAVTATLGDAAAPEAAPVTPSFHLLLNDVVIRDDRIPPWRMDYSEARKRNALPVPPTQYLAAGVLPEDGSKYLHYDEVTLDPPAGAVRAEIALLYQTTSWEYLQFLWKANDKGNVFLESVGDDLLEAWLATNQSAPVVMATTAVPEPSAAPLAALLTLAALVANRREPSRSAADAAKRCARLDAGCHRGSAA